MLFATVAEIAGVRVLADQIDQPCPAQIVRQLPGRRFIQPHQRRMQFEWFGHAQIERGIQRLDGLVAAIRIAGIIRLAHPADDVTDAAAVGQRSGEGEKHQIAARHERIGQAVLAHLDRDVTRQRGIGNRGQGRNVQRVAFAQLPRPIRPQGFDPVQQAVAAVKFDGMTLAVAESERFDVRKALQRPGEAGRGILSAGEQHQRGFGLQLIAHGHALPPIGIGTNRWK